MQTSIVHSAGRAGQARLGGQLLRVLASVRWKPSAVCQKRPGQVPGELPLWETGKGAETPRPQPFHRHLPWG